MIVPIQEERLLQMGEWLSINGEAIYDSSPWTVQNDTVTPGVWLACNNNKPSSAQIAAIKSCFFYDRYTSNPSRKQVYALVLNWPGDQLYLGSVDPTTVDSVSILGASGSISVRHNTINSLRTE